MSLALWHAPFHQSPATIGRPTSASATQATQGPAREQAGHHAGVETARQRLVERVAGHGVRSRDDISSGERRLATVLPTGNGVPGLVLAQPGPASPLRTRKQVMILLGIGVVK